MNTILREFRSDVKNGQYTKCERGHIIGSDLCRGCCHFVGKIVENEKKDGRYTLVTKGIVECTKIKEETKC